MCTLALYFRALGAYPLIVAANRDEHYDRPSAAPYLWRTKPVICAGKDLLAGGTWLGVNDHGLFAGILNRRLNGAEKPPAAVRSRGLLCLDLLGFKSAADGCDFLQSHEQQYQPFILVFADVEQAWLAQNLDQKIHTLRLPEGLHVLSNAGESAKVSRAHGQFARLGAELGSKRPHVLLWPDAFAGILRDHVSASGSNDPRDAICVHGDLSGTVSSSLIVYSQNEGHVKTFFCPGPPCQHHFGKALTLAIQ